MKTGWSRREFAALAAGTIAAPFVGDPIVGRASRPQDVVYRIKKQVGVDWNPETVDTFKAGQPASPLTGIAVTNLATLSVLARAVKAGSNLIITCEPTFYARADRPTPPAGRGAAARPLQPPLRTRHGRSRRQDRIRSSPPNRTSSPGIASSSGASATIGGCGRRIRSHRASSTRSAGPDSEAPTDPSRVSVPASTLAALAPTVKKKLDARGGMRVIGDERLTVQTVGVLPATTAIQAALKMLPKVDAIIAGEIREWESSEYARDTSRPGRQGADSRLAVRCPRIPA